MSNVSKFSKITILGDSSQAPRPENGVMIDDTYPLLLANIGDYIVLNKSKISADTSFFLTNESLTYDIKYAKSTYFIINLGICDCSPRIFTSKQRKLLEAFAQYSVFNKLIMAYISKMSKNRLYFTKKHQIQNVSVAQFRSNIEKIISEIKLHNEAKKIFIINIIEPSSELAERSFGLKSNISIYNQCLLDICALHKDITHLIDINSFTKQNPEVVTQPDGHHYDKRGHKFIYQKIRHALKSMMHLE